MSVQLAATTSFDPSTIRFGKFHDSQQMYRINLKDDTQEYEFKKLNLDGSITQGAETITYKKPDDRAHPRMYALGVAVTVISAGLLTAACITTFPLSGPISLFALSVLTATSYGIANDLFACKKCIQYFTVGHTPMHRRLLKTENPIANAFAWGIHATWVLGALAGVLFATSAMATGLAVAPILPYLAAAKIAGALVTLVYAHFRSKAEEHKWNTNPQRDTFFETVFIKPRKHFHIVDLSLVPEDKRAAYMAVGARNGAGYAVMPIVGVIALIAITTLGLVL